MGSNIDHECVSGDVFRSDVVVASEKEDDFGGGSGFSELDAEFEGIDFSLTAVEDVVSVPTVFSVNKLVAGGYLFGSGKDGWSIAACEGVVTNDEQWQFGSFEFLADSMSSSCDFGEDCCCVSQVGVSVGEISWSADVKYFSFLLLSGLQDSCIEDGGFRSRIDSN